MDFLTTTLAVPYWGLGCATAVFLAACVTAGLVYRKHRTTLTDADDLRMQLEAYEDQIRELSDSKDRYRELYSQAPVGIFRTSVDGKRVLAANENAAQMFGYETLEDFLGHCVPKDAYVDLENRKKLITALRENGVVDGFEVMISRPDGNMKYLALSARMDTGNEYLEGAILDITARKLAERELHDGHLFLQTVMDTIPNPLYYRDRNARLRHVNKSFEKFMGIARGEVVGMGIDEILPGEVSQGLRRNDGMLLADKGESMQRLTGWVRTRGAGQRDVIIHEGTVRDSGGRRIGIVGVFTDFTELKQAQSERERAEAVCSNVFENSTEGIFTLLPEGRFLRVNPAMAELLGYDSTEKLIADMQDIRTQMYVSPVQHDEILSILAEKGEVVGAEVEAARADGSRFWLSMSLKATPDGEGGIAHIDGIAQDISVRKGEERELTRRATTDSLTGLPNRFVFDQTLERMVAQSRRSGEKVGVLFMDLDGFKNVNDELGHAAGDALLAEVGKRLCARVRESDVVARIGGDEFGLLLWNINGPEDIELISEEIIESVNQPVVTEDSEGEIYSSRVGVSIGASISPDHGTDAAGLVRRADKAMYAVKESGRNNLAMAVVAEG